MSLNDPQWGNRGSGDDDKPDGSESEKSGNGLRIFARYLWDRGG